MTRCPHSAHGTPSTCSQCAGAVPRLVEQHGADITIDGEVARAIEPAMSEAQLKYARRGGKHTHRSDRK